MSISFIEILDNIGTFAFAISGIRLAAAKKFDLYGAFVVGFVTAVGGGTLRDLMLDRTPFWMVQPSYVIVTTVALLTVIVLKSWMKRLSLTFLVFDAIGLALFTVVGIERSNEVGYPIWVSIIMGCITGAAGGVFRDVLVNEEPLIFRKDIYAMACIGGGLVYWLGTSLGIAKVPVQTISAISVFLIRLLCVHYKISLPVLSAEDKED